MIVEYFCNLGPLQWFVSFKGDRVTITEKVWAIICTNIPEYWVSCVRARSGDSESRPTTSIHPTPPLCVSRNVWYIGV